MNTKPIKLSFSMRATVTLLLLVLTMTGAWAQAPTTVTTEGQLKDAITDGANIQLTADILLSNYLNIEGVTVTIDLNGHKLSRNLSDYDRAGHVIWAHNGSNLTLTSSVSGGSIEGGMAYNGGAIHIPNGNTVSATDVIFQNNSAFEHAGAIWNNGTFTATNCTFTDNTASDVGAIYNSVTETNGTTYAGTASLTDCTFERNAGTAGAGALANALGATVMTIDGCTIRNNTADTYGAGIWNGGTLNMKGKITVQDNTNVGGLVSNLYLKNLTVITVIGSLTGSSIGVELESVSGTFTSGYSNYQHGSRSVFTADRSSIVALGTSGGERCLMSWAPNPICFIERSWDETNKKVVNTERSLTTLIANDVEPTIDGQYKEVTSAPVESPNQWFQMGGYNNNVAEYYVVRGDVMRQTIVVQGKDVHLILCNGATLTLTGGLKLEGDNKLYIHSQSYGGDMGRLMVTNSFNHAAGIGSATVNYDYSVRAGELVIYGGHIEAHGGTWGAGIGSCSKAYFEKESDFCKSVTVYGGYVKAVGGDDGAGIGGGNRTNGGDFILYDGTVIAVGGKNYYNNNEKLENYTGGAGVGGGHSGVGGNVTIYGGSLTATGCKGGAGIGGGRFGAAAKHLYGGTFTIYGGTVTATGGGLAAGIGGGAGSGGGYIYMYGGTVTAKGGGGGAGIGGGGYDDSAIGSNGGEVYIYGGTLSAIGGNYCAGIGGTYEGKGGKVTITGGTVTAIGGEEAPGIGGGNEGEGGEVTITGGTVITKGGEGEEEGAIDGYAIGSGARNTDNGTLTIGDAMMVGAGDNGSVESIFDANERKNGCWFHSYAEISPCSHSEATYTVEGNDANGTHTLHCSHCATQFETEPHDFNGTGECTLCHFKGTVHTVTIYLPDANDDDTYEEDGRYKTYQYNMVAGTTFTLPGAPQDLYDMEFAGWLVTTGTVSSSSSYRTYPGEMLLPEKAEYTLERDVNFVARYKDIAIYLADNSDNGEKLYNYDGKKATSVTLAGRTLYKDGGWNTLCLPFSLTEAEIAASLLAGADIRTLASSSFDESKGTLTLTFTAKDEVTSITAGTPYIVKWEPTTPNFVSNPILSNVIISNATTPVETDVVDFVGTFSPYDIFTEEKTNLYLGADNKLYYPAGENLTSFTVNAFRAFFQLKNGLTAGEPTSPELGIKAFVLNIDGRETGIEEVQGSEFRVQASGWYSIDGRKLEGRPKSKGIYLFEGRKVLIK